MKTPDDFHQTIKLRRGWKCAMRHANYSLIFAKGHYFGVIMIGKAHRDNCYAFHALYFDQPYGRMGNKIINKRMPQWVQGAEITASISHWTQSNWSQSIRHNYRNICELVLLPSVAAAGMESLAISPVIVRYDSGTGMQMCRTAGNIWTKQSMYA